MNYTTLRSPYGMSRPSVSVVCDVVALYPDHDHKSYGKLCMFNC